MELGTILTIMGLAAVAVMLWSCLSVLSPLFPQFGLLDRDQRLSRLRIQLRLALLVTVAAAMAMPFVPGSPDLTAHSEFPDLAAAKSQANRQEFENRQLAEQLESLQLEIENIAVATEDPVEAGNVGAIPETATLEAAPSGNGAVPEETVKPTAAQPTKRLVEDPPNWLSAIIVSSGEVTLRAWPNGRQIRKLLPGTRVYTNQELRSAGDYMWVRVKTDAGQIGWIVDRFVALEEIR